METRKAFAVACLIGLGLGLYGLDFVKALGASLIAFLMLGGWRLIRRCQMIPRDVRYVFYST